MPSSQQWNSEGSNTSTSKPFPLKIGNSTTIYTVKTETNITNSQVGASKLTLQDSVTARSGKTDRALATSTDGGKSWSPTKDASGNNILTQDQLKSLQPGGALNNAVKSTAQIDAKANGASPQQLNQLSNGNAAATAEGTGATNEPQQTVDLNQAQSNLNKLKIGDSSKTRKVSEYPGEQYLKYPIGLDTSKQDYIKITMLEYAPKNINLTGIAKGDPFGERSTEGKRRGSSVILPIQPSISDSNTVQWGSGDMNAAEAIAAAGALGAIKGAAAGAEEALKATSSLLTGASDDLKTAVAAGLAERAAGTKGLLTRTTGGIINPNMELLFQGPNLRGFNFTFSLSAREPDEAKIIRNIIRFFKQGMSVKRASTGLFLKSPHTFEIKYMIGTEEHPWINKIKECALTSFNVNYTPAGNYATFYDGAMTQYDISMQFSELEPVYDDDYETKSTTFESEIGY